jgi:hypothetical protein
MGCGPSAKVQDTVLRLPSGKELPDGHVICHFCNGTTWRTRGDGKHTGEACTACGGHGHYPARSRD